MLMAFLRQPCMCFLESYHAEKLLLGCSHGKTMIYFALWDQLPFPAAVWKAAVRRGEDNTLMPALPWQRNTELTLARRKTKFL
ncbi:hypothetical protein GUJ93_ZPchr0015g6594 [Zizania palustris]|uniref:Uncharacterized protein n=1 Tax=Zizania palustris TaxID=103762 RepID=A0A8J5SYX0_ZIZPA|nr:hypothetical protein GUJ93_ZPchr0015g6594 [Zizania palustris]